MWAGLLADCVIGPYLLPERRDMLHVHRRLTPLLLEDVPVASRDHMQYLHDGAPPLYGRRVCNLIDEKFHGKLSV